MFHLVQETSIKCMFFCSLAFFTFACTKYVSVECILADLTITFYPEPVYHVSYQIKL